MFLFLINLLFFASGLYLVATLERGERKVHALIIIIAGYIGCCLGAYSMGVDRACQEILKSLSG